MGKAGITVNGKAPGAASPSSPSPSAANQPSPAQANASQPGPAISRPAVAQTPVPVVEANGLPSYCKPKKTYISGIDDQIERYKRPYHSFEAMHELALSTCEKAKPEKQARIDGHMANFKAWMGLSEPEYLQLFSIYIDKRGANQESKTFCDTLKVEDEDLATNKEKAYLRVVASAAGCSGTIGASSYDWPDQDLVTRSLDVGSCYRALDGRMYGGSQKPTPYTILSYSECNAMSQRIDVTKSIAAVRANDSFNFMAKADFIALLTSIDRNKKRYDPIFKKLGQKDEIYEELIYTAPNAAYAAWYENYNADKKLMDEMNYILAHGSNKYLMKKVGDCSEKYFERLKTIAKNSSATSVDEFKDALSKPVNGLTAASYVFCEAAQKQEAVAAIYRSSAVSYSLALGPRDAARKAAMAVLAANRGEIKGARDMSSYSRGFEFPDWRSGSREERRGVIQSAKASGDVIKVTFKKESWQEPTYSCRETNKIDGIKDGKLVYRQKCRKTGSKTVKHHEQPVEFPMRHASYLKVGQFLIFTRPLGNSVAMPKKVYRTKKQDKLVGLLGLPL
jgi:hypothetical protein